MRLLLATLLFAAPAASDLTVDQSAGLVHYAKAQLAKRMGDGQRYLLELDQATTVDPKTALPNQEYLAVLKALGRDDDALRHLKDMHQP